MKTRSPWILGLAGLTGAACQDSPVTGPRPVPDAASATHDEGGCSGP